MDLSVINPVLLIAALMSAATPILLAATGELVAERVGVLNLGVEGMMIIGAICGFAIAVMKSSNRNTACARSFCIYHRKLWR